MWHTHRTGTKGFFPYSKLGWSGVLVEIIMCWCRDEDIVYREKYQGKFQLVAANTMETCLDATVNKRLSASERRRTSLSACEWNANQV